MLDGAAKLQEFVKKGSADLQRNKEEHWMKICKHLGALLAERVVEV